MAEIKNVRVGQTVYSEGKNPQNKISRINPIKIIDIDYETDRILASWNNATPKWFQKSAWGKWKVRKKLLKKEGKR